MCIYYSIIGYNYGYYLTDTAYGIKAVSEFLEDVFVNVINLCFNPITLCIIILWVGYQIYYFISFKSDKKEHGKYSKESNVHTSKNINLKKILFYISILCWVIYFASGVFAFFFGSNTGGRIIRSCHGIWHRRFITYIILKFTCFFAYTSITSFIIIYNYLFDNK